MSQFLPHVPSPSCLALSFCFAGAALPEPASIPLADLSLYKDSVLPTEASLPVSHHSSATPFPFLPFRRAFAHHSICKVPQNPFTVALPAPPVPSCDTSDCYVHLPAFPSCHPDKACLLKKDYRFVEDVDNALFPRLPFPQQKKIGVM